MNKQAIFEGRKILLFLCGLWIVGSNFEKYIWVCKVENSEDRKEIH
jgi:hypothetical protein